MVVMGALLWWVGGWVRWGGWMGLMGQDVTVHTVQCTISKRMAAKHRACVCVCVCNALEVCECSQPMCRRLWVEGRRDLSSTGGQGSKWSSQFKLCGCETAKVRYTGVVCLSMGTQVDMG